MSQRSDRRTAVRHPRRMKVPCSRKHVIEETPFEAAVVLLSCNAVRIRVAEPPAGVHLAVDLPDARGRVAGMPFTVTRTRPATGGSHFVEGSFVKQLDARAVQTVQARLGPHGWKTVCRSIRVREEGPWLATMLNVSHSGIGLVTEQSFDPGTFLEVRLPSVRRQHLRPRIIRVINVRPHEDGGDWFLGAVFVRALTDEELQLLL